MKFSIFVISVLTIAQTSYAEESCGIVDENFLYNKENSVAPSEYPWTAFLIALDSDEHRVFHCAAVLISKRTVITTHQCLAYQTGNVIEVALGNWQRAQESDCVQIGNECVARTYIYTIDEIILNPSYIQVLMKNNIGLVRLDRDVVFGRYMQPICLPPADITLDQLIAKNLYLTGYGFDKSAFTIARHKSFAHIMSPEQCQNFYELLEILDEHICCVINSKNATEWYRIGVALMDVKVENSKPKYFYLVGILSFGSSAGDLPDVFASVINHLKWIKRNLD